MKQTQENWRDTDPEDRRDRVTHPMPTLPEIRLHILPLSSVRSTKSSFCLGIFLIGSTSYSQITFDSNIDFCSVYR